MRMYIFFPRGNRLVFLDPRWAPGSDTSSMLASLDLRPTPPKPMITFSQPNVEPGF